jgi:hypothetical protein
MAANCGEREPAAVAKRTQRAPLRRRNLRNELTRSAEGSAKRANEATESAAQHPERANEPIASAVERMVPIGRIASSPRREGVARTGKTKPRSSKRKGSHRSEGFSRSLVATFGSPEVGDLRSIGRAGSGHLCQPNSPDRMARLQKRAGGRHGPSGLAAPVRVRSFPRCRDRLGGLGREAGETVRSNRSGTSGGKTRRM